MTKRETSSGGKDNLHRRKKDALLDSKKIAEMIIEAVPTWVKLVAADGNLQRMNRAGLDMIQVDSLDEVQGQCLYPLVDDEHRDAFKTMLQDIFQGKSRTFEFRMIGLKGRPCWLYTHTVPLRNDRGEIISALSVTTDITERKLAENERKKLILELKDALANVKTLSEMLPICAYCKKIRDDKGYWEGVETYISKNTDTVFTHGICPECGEKAIKELMEFKKNS